MKRYDHCVLVRSSSGVQAAVLALGIIGARAPDARACSLAAPGISFRSVWPGPDKHPPTNTRVVISYSTGAAFAGATIPPLGPDVVLQEKDGTAVASSFEVLGGSVVITPASPLLANHAYQVADRRTVPCVAFNNQCALGGTAQPFAFFTTGAAADDTPPVFAGASSIAIEQERTCDSDACCGTYDLFPVNVDWATGSDDTSGTDLRYNVYHAEGTALTLVAQLVDGMRFTGDLFCSGDLGSLHLQAGNYVVRAVDWAGHEDANARAQHLDNPCHTFLGCAVAPAAPDRPRWPWTVASLFVVMGGWLLRRINSGRPRRSASGRRPSKTGPHPGRRSV